MTTSVDAAGIAGTLVAGGVMIAGPLAGTGATIAGVAGPRAAGGATMAGLAAGGVTIAGPTTCCRWGHDCRITYCRLGHWWH